MHAQRDGSNPVIAPASAPAGLHVVEKSDTVELYDIQIFKSNQQISFRST
jgi:hypothetical protein